MSRISELAVNILYDRRAVRMSALKRAKCKDYSCCLQIGLGKVYEAKDCGMCI